MSVKEYRFFGVGQVGESMCIGAGEVKGGSCIALNCAPAFQRFELRAILKLVPKSSFYELDERWI